jgi:hypothetical protein
MRSEPEESTFPAYGAAPAADEPDLVETERGRAFAARLAGLIAIVLLAATFRIGVDKDLIRTITPEEWGRYNFAISAAITDLRFSSLASPSFRLKSLAMRPELPIRHCQQFRRPDHRQLPPFPLAQNVVAPPGVSRVALKPRPQPPIQSRLCMGRGVPGG